MTDTQNAFFKDFVSQVFAGQNLGVDAVESKLQNEKKLKKESHAELELALCVLLVDLAGCDQNFDQSEYQLISKALKKLFGTSTMDVSALVNQANLALANLRGVSQFASLLKDSLTADQKQSILEIIEEIIAADGQEDAYETHLRSKLHRLLGIEAS